MVISNSLDLIIKHNPEYDQVKIEEIKYGLEGLYLTITKTIIIFSIAFFLGILKELIIFTLIYNIIRMPSFGMHASSSIICLISSTTMFIGLTFLCMVIIIPTVMKFIIGCIGLLLIIKNSPADTEKRPIINSKRRLIYKVVSSLLAILFIFLAFNLSNTFLSNCFLLCLLLQSFMTEPLVYRLFGQSYDNYKKYLNDGLNLDLNIDE